MATSLENRQYRLGQVGTLNGVIRPFPDSPIHNLQNDVVQFNNSNNIHKPSAVSLSLQKPFQRENGYDEDDDDEKPDWTEEIRRANNELEPSIHDPRDEATSDNWIERNPAMIRLMGKHPFNSEPPLSRLMHSGLITPVPLYYVRNHGAAPRAKWEDWKVEATGLVRSPQNFTTDELMTSGFEQREFPVTLGCAGNSRKEQNMVRQSIGLNWGAAGTSTSVWGGVPLGQLLKRCRITRGRGHYAFFEGSKDLPGGGGSKYGTSLKVELAMDPAMVRAINPECISLTTISNGDTNNNLPPTQADQLMDPTNLPAHQQPVNNSINAPAGSAPPGGSNPSFGVPKEQFMDKLVGSGLAAALIGCSMTALSSFPSLYPKHVLPTGFFSALLGMYLGAFLALLLSIFLHFWEHPKPAKVAAWIGIGYMVATAPTICSSFFFPDDGQHSTAAVWGPLATLLVPLATFFLAWVAKKAIAAKKPAGGPAINDPECPQLS